MGGVSEDQKSVLIGKVLMPEATLDAIAQEYGVTRQRVCNIFKASVGRTYSEVKQDLISEKFKCVVDGKPIPMSKIVGKGPNKRNYCSEDCRRIVSAVDIDQLAQCKYSKCSTYFFVNRNWKFTKKKEFCCIKHYVAHMNEAGHDADSIAQ